ncbi:CapA family protein [Oceanicola sp. 502str15]|uniref:CapA family protein n=1 Tax=Oceanicola sp. 502str15 TaxID=2696061 RepID=UPI0020960E99|nr:CapA family protein [Oceanicola sp. 502str15]MCO6382682.1 hypothetical protein [Oceanicola sp. 502str15]
MRIVLLGQAIIHAPVAWSEELRGLVAGADAVVCNFEGSLPDAGCWPMKLKTVHPMHEGALGMLRDLGVTHLALANNHAWDFGHAGLLATRAKARAAGFAVAGTGRDGAEAWSAGRAQGVALVSVDAGPTPDWAIAGMTPGVAALRLRRRIGLPQDDIDRLTALAEATGDLRRRALRAQVGFDPATDRLPPFGLDLEVAPEPLETFEPDPEDIEMALRAIRAARAQAERVIVALHYHHWSPDWLSPPDWLGPVAEAFLQAGADGVAGTGPPWAFGVDGRPEGLIAPSLGNLVFHTRRGERYDAMGLPVWKGAAAVLEGGAWRGVEVAVARPAGTQSR